MSADCAVTEAAWRASPDDPMAWHRHGLALLGQGRIDDLLAFADQAAGRFGSALKFVHNLLLDLAGQGGWSVLAGLVGQIAPERPEYVLALYYGGCAQLVAGQPVRAAEAFARFAAQVVPRHQQFPLVSDANFNLIFRQGVLVEPPAVVESLAAQPLPVAHPIHFLDPAPSAPPSFAIVCVLDRRYFERFAPSVCAAHVQAGTLQPLHFHVLAADDGALALCADLRARHNGLALSFSWEAPGRWDNPVYYTCARFLVMRRLMDHFQSPVLTQDADIMALAPMQSFADAAAGADFACFRTGRWEPASVYQASIMMFAPTAPGLAFIDDLCRFVAAKLDMPPVLGWMLDQAALFSVLTQRAEQGGFAFIGLEQAMGRTLEELTRNFSSAEEKGRIMGGGVSAAPV